MKVLSKFIKRILVILLTIILCFILFLFIFLLFLSPGKVDPYLDSNNNPLQGSIAERVFIKVGGVQQGLIIKSKNNKNPVLLYLHGGPSFPNYFLIDKFKPELEDYFTVCYWEQRGGGLSYSNEVSIQSMSFEQLSEDALEVTNYLINRFKQEKIYIFAHSGGTPIALLAISKAPQLFNAYLAMAQITNQAESERIAYNYILEKYKELRNERVIKELLEYNYLKSDTNLFSFYKSALRDKSMHELGIGTMHKMNSIFWDIFIPVWTCKAYKLGEKIDIWKSKFSFLPKTNLYKELLSTDFSQKIKKIDIPVYFFCGKYDYTVNYILSKIYFDSLEAPIKRYYLFENSAHSPLFEEPEKLKQIIKDDVLRARVSTID